MCKPDICTAKALAGEYGVIPVGRTIRTAGRTPADAFRILKKLSRQCFVLESAEDAERYGRYTFLGYDPKLEISCANGELRILGSADFRFATRDCATHIRKLLDDNRSPRFDWLPPFSGGLVGYFSYEYIAYTEPRLRLGAADNEHFKDFDLMLFDKVIAFDHLADHILLIVNMRTDTPEENYNRAVSELEHMQNILENGAPA